MEAIDLIHNLEKFLLLILGVIFGLLSGIFLIIGLFLRDRDFLHTASKHFSVINVGCLGLTFLLYLIPYSIELFGGGGSILIALTIICFSADLVQTSFPNLISGIWERVKKNI